MEQIFFTSLFWIVIWLLSKVWSDYSKPFKPLSSQDEVNNLDIRDDIDTRYVPIDTDSEQTANWKEAMNLIELYADDTCDIDPQVINVVQAYGYIITKQDTTLRKY